MYRNKSLFSAKNVSLFIAGFLICFVLVISILPFIPTPAEIKLKVTNKKLKNEFSQLNERLKTIESQLDELNVKDDSLYRIILDIKPLPATVKKAGTGGAASTFVSDNLITNQILKKVNSIDAEVSMLEYSLNETFNMASKRNFELLRTPTLFPLMNKEIIGIGSVFGMRNHPILGINKMHEGIDIYAKKGTSVFATAAGVVKSVGYSASFGNLIVVDHETGFETYYGHLDKFNVKKNQRIERGEVIGFVGNSGLTNGSHLHYEIHVNGKEVDPEKYIFSDLTPEQYKQIIYLSASKK